MVTRMNNAARCPIGGEQIDDNAARINAALTLFVLALGVLTPSSWLIAYLVVDYAIKVFFGFRYSPNCRMAQVIAEDLHFPKQMVDSAPKRFAAVVALLMSALALALAYLAPQAKWAFFVVTGLFMVFTALETFAGFCVGCYLYRFLPDPVARALHRRLGREALNV